MKYQEMITVCVVIAVVVVVLYVRILEEAGMEWMRAAYSHLIHPTNYISNSYIFVYSFF